MAEDSFFIDLPDDQYTPPGGWTPGNDTTTVPTSDPWAGADPLSIFKTASTFATGALKAYTGFLNQRDAISFATQDRALRSKVSQAQIDLANKQIDSTARIDDARIAAQTKIAERQFAAMPGLTTLFGGSSAPAGTDWLMLALTAVGVYFAWRAVGKHA